MSELKKCPFCGQKARERYTQVDLFSCSNINCELCHVVFSADEWNTRPLEDALTARIAELELLYQLAQGRIELGDSKIAELQSRIARLEKAGDALMYYADYNDEDNIWRCIKCGSLWKHINDEKHYDDCPVTEWQEAKK